MSRKQQLNALFGLTPAAGPEVKSGPAEAPAAAAQDPPALGAPNISSMVHEPLDAALPPASTPRVRSGAVGAMSASLQQIAAGERVIELDPSLIDPAPVADRLIMVADPSLVALKASIAESGQQVPVLVRSHPARPGRWQAAYGHRRISACRALGLPVKAVVRALDDEQLAVAQGQENSARRDLSFIEKAFFAAGLAEAGLARATIISALATDKADLSRYLGVARAVPRELAAAIGPAPKAGRARWMALAAALENAGWHAGPFAKMPDRVEGLVQTEGFEAADSDTRFAWVLAALRPGKAEVSQAELLTAPQASKAEPLIVRDEEGRELARVEFAKPEQDKGKPADGQALLTVSETNAPGFAQFVAEFLTQEIPELHRRWRDGAGRS